MSCAQGGTGSGRRGQARGSAVPGFRRGHVDGCPFRGIQAVHQEGCPVRAGPPAPARLRLEAARPYRPSPHRAMVRPVQPDRSGQRQSRARSSHADPQLRDRPRSPRNQPGAGRAKKPETSAHPLPVPGGDRPAPPGPGRADPQEQPGAGGRHPAPASHRVPQKRDPPAALVGGRSRQAGPRRRQDGSEDRSPQYPGPAHPGRAAQAPSSSPPREIPPGRASSAGRAAQAPSSSPPREIPPGRAAATFRSGTAPDARQASRTFACTISAIPTPATR